MLSTVLFLLGLFIGLLLFYEHWRDRGIPPGPPRLPLLGNLHQAPSGDVLPWMVYDQWRQKYGDIFSVRFGKDLFVMIADETGARDLLEKRGQK